MRTSAVPRTAALVAGCLVLLFGVGLLLGWFVAGRDGAGPGGLTGPASPGAEASNSAPPVRSPAPDSVSPTPAGGRTSSGAAPSDTASATPTATSGATNPPTATPSSDPSPTSSAPTGTCTAESFVAPAVVDPAAVLSRVAERQGVSFEASWYDPQAGVVTAGELTRLPAWSTAKVPMALAVVRAGRGAEYSDTIAAAIRTSDNDAADRLWRALGTDDAARAAAVGEVLRAAGDTTTAVPSTRRQPPYSIVGQTRWTTAAQVGFVRQLPCLTGADQVLDDMAGVSSAQSWGVGRLPAATFKGGWGPTGSGYLVRQFGWYETPTGQRVAIAIAVQADTFDRGVQALDAMSEALRGS